MHLLFVCVGNSCRSQMAEGIARSMGHSADSAGTHPAEYIASNAVVVLNNRGISAEGMVPKNVGNFSADDSSGVPTGFPSNNTVVQPLNKGA